MHAPPKTDRITLSDKKFQALQYRCQGKSYAWIALKLQTTSIKMAQYWVQDALRRIDRARKGEHRLVVNYY
jgi:transcriptional regulator